MTKAQEKYITLLKTLCILDKCKLTGVRKIEVCFHTCFSCWLELERCTDIHKLAEPARISFVKTIRAPIIALIEFYLFCYHAALFEPLDKERSMEFWQRESLRLQKFADDHAEFYAYYKSGSTALDELYFTTTVDRYFPGCSATTYDVLLGRTLALEKYKVHVQKILTAT